MDAVQNNQAEVSKTMPKIYEKVSLNNIKIMNVNKEKKLPKYVKEFCKNTQLYGFSYLAEPRRFKIEKCYWLSFILISFCVCLNLLIGSWFNWSRDPILILKQNPKPINQIPFPAITICPETKVRQRVYNFTYNYHSLLNNEFENLLSPEFQTFSDTSLVCDNHLYGEGNKTTNNEIFDRLRNIAPSLDETFVGCKWTNLNSSCETYFIPGFTEDGLCFTFNMLSKREIFNNFVLQDDQVSDELDSDGWTLETGYLSNTGETYPRRTTTSGTKGGFFILLKADERDFDYVCRSPVQGFRVLLHHPSELPRISSHYFRGPLDQEVLVTVKPNMITTNPDLKKYSPTERQCLFDGERSLKFFRNYTQGNCRIECLTNQTLEKCGCVPFYMPRETSTPICGSGSNVCVFEAEQELLEQNAESNTCDCLPACTSLTYSAEITQANFNLHRVLQSFNADLDEFSEVHMTRIVVFFDNIQFDASVRTKLRSDYTEFLAQCGGLLMLFTGFSFLSIAEIVYFLFLRLICNVKKYGKQRWAGFSETSEFDSLNQDILAST